MAKRPKTQDQLAAEARIKRARDLEAVNLQPDAASLERHADVEVTRAGSVRDRRKVDTDQARRLDAFAALKDGMAPGCYDAARRLERDILTRYGWTDRGRSGERVDCTLGFTTDARLKAGRTVDNVTARLSFRDAWLLVELISGHPDRPRWRDTVAFITGEANPHAQCAVVRAACVNLRDAYEAVDAKRRAAA